MDVTKVEKCGCSKQYNVNDQETYVMNEEVCITHQIKQLEEKRAELYRELDNVLIKLLSLKSQK